MRLRNITIQWTYPVCWENINSHDYRYNDGIYYISSKYNTRWGIKEKPLYIGKTKRSFYERLNEHFNSKSKFTAEKGKLYVRFGLITSPVNIKGIVGEEYDNLLKTIESGLIWELNKSLTKKLVNISQTKGYTLYHELKINNTGFRGALPKVIPNREHLQP